MNKYLLKIYTKHDKLIGIFISLFSLGIAFISLNIAIKSNAISLEAKNINKDNLGIQLDQISQNYVSQAYDDLYYNPDNSFVMKLIIDNRYISDKQILTRVVDTFEGVGSGACQGTIKFRHIKPYLFNSLKYICTNNQILDEFGGKRNGLSILCKELHSDSKFAKAIDNNNISTCEFWDSLNFPNSQNRYRFEVR